MATPDDFGWGPPCPADRIVVFSAGGIRLSAHAAAAPIFQAFIEDIVSRGYKVAGPIPDDWGYNCRRIAGSNTWSWHAWGLAIDLNALKNPMGPDLITDMPPWIDEVAAQYGIFWGGNFNRRKDAMHFELHLTPAEAKQMREDLEGKEPPEMTKEELIQVVNSDAFNEAVQKAVEEALVKRAPVGIPFVTADDERGIFAVTPLGLIHVENPTQWSALTGGKSLSIAPMSVPADWLSANIIGQE